MFQAWFKKNFIFIVIGAVLTMQNCNTNEKPAILADVDNCLQCGMVISQVNQGCGYISNNEFKTFCSPTCLLNKYQSTEKPGRPAATQVYFADYPTTDLLQADSVMFLLTKHITTVMNSGVLTFKEVDIASSFSKHEDEIITNWRGFQMIRGKADKKVEVHVSPEGIKPQVILLSKDDIVEWIFMPTEPGFRDSIQLKGYEEMTNIEIPAGGESVVIRMLADKPGEGFPIIRLSDNSTLGMVKVIGAHTSDEEVM